MLHKINSIFFTSLLFITNNIEGAQRRHSLECYFSGRNYSRQIYPEFWKIIECYAEDTSDPACMYGYLHFIENNKNATLLVAGCGNYEKCLLHAPPTMYSFLQFRPDASSLALTSACCYEPLCNKVKIPSRTKSPFFATNYIHKLTLKKILWFWSFIYCIKLSFL